MKTLIGTPIEKPVFSSIGDPRGLKLAERLRALLSAPSSTDYGEWTDERTTDPVWVEDFEGLLREIPVGDLVYEGARVVKNLLPNTDMSHADWEVVGVTKSAGTTSTGMIASYSTTSTDRVQIDSSAGMPTTAGNGEEYILSIKARLAVSGAGHGVQLNQKIGGVFEAQDSIELSTEWQRISSGVCVDETGGPAVIELRHLGLDAYDIEFDEPMWENVTGQTNQNPSEYVSVGAGDGTEIVSGDNATFDSSIGDWTGEDCTLAVSGGALKVTYSAATQRAKLDDSVLNLVDGADYIVTADVWTDDAGTVGETVEIGWSSSFGDTVILSTEAQEVTDIFTAVSGGYLNLFTTLDSGEYYYIDNVSLQKLTTGFAYKDTANGNTVTSNVVTEATGAALDPVPYLLHVPSATNLVTYSSEFDNAAWIKYDQGSGVSPVVTANYGVAPDGTYTVDRVQFDCGGVTSNDISVLIKQFSVTIGDTYTASLYAKSLSGTPDIQLNLSNTGFGNDGEVIVTLSATEWTRLEYTETASATGTGQITLGCLGSKTSQTVDMLIWGAQLEESSFATNYIPTSGATETRNATDYQLALTKDYQRGAYDSPELVANGTFDTDLSGWTYTGTENRTWDAANGGSVKCTRIGVTGWEGIHQNNTVTSGETYYMTGQYYTDDYASFRAGVTGDYETITTTTGSWQSFAITVTATDHYIYAYTLTGSIGDVIYFDNISVKRVLSDDEQWATYGSELVTNGTFDTDLSGWIDTNCTSSWDSGGYISVTYASSAGGVSQSFPTVVGQTYEATATIVSSTGYSVYTLLRCGNGSTPNAGIADSSSYTTPSTKTVTFTATGTTSYVYLRSGGSYIIEWDNISVKPVSYNYEEFKQSEGTLIFDWVPEYDPAAGNKGLFSIKSTSALTTLFDQNVAIQFRSQDGTNSSSSSNAFDSGDKIRLALRWSTEENELNLGSRNITANGDWVWSGGVSYDGAFDTDDIAALFVDNPYINQLHNLQIYDRTLTTNEIEGLS